VLFATFYSGKNAEEEASILQNAAVLKAGFLADDIETDFNSLLGTGVDINRGSALTTIVLTDSLGPDVNKEKLIELEEFAEGALATTQNASIELDVSEMADGRTELLFGNGLQYDYSYSDDNIVQLYVPGGNTNISVIDLNVSIDALSVGAVPWTWQDVTGDINVNLHYVDRNSLYSVTHYGKLDSSANNQYTIAFSGAGGDSFTINIGNIDGNLKAVRLTESIDTAGARASVWMKVRVPSPAGELKAYYNADLNFAQADVNLDRKPEMAAD